MPPSSRLSVIKLAWPVLIAQLAVFANGVVDTIMAGHYAALDLAAVGIGASTYASIFFALVGVTQAVTPIVAQLVGAKRTSEVGEEIRQALWLAVALIALGLLLLHEPHWILQLSHLEPAVEAKSVAYLRGLAWVVPAVLFARVLQAFFTAIARPRVMMLLNVLALAIKIPLNYVFMYGHFGFPEMGGPGCAYATAVAAWITLCISLAISASGRYREYALWQRFSWPQWTRQRQLLRLGLPMGFALMVEITSFTFIALFVARLGATTSAAHQIAANVAALSYMFPLAVGNATGVLVGQAVGARDLRGARAVGFAGMGVGALCAVIIFAIVTLATHAIVGVYTDDPRVNSLAVSLLAFVAVFQLFDGAQAICANALRGYKITFAPMLIYVVVLWGVGLGGGYWLGLTDIGLHWPRTPMGAAGFWLAAVVSVVLAAVLLMAYFGYVSRERMRENQRAP